MNTPFGGIENLKAVYFIGIGGIGMSAIARYFVSKNVSVSGYDKTPGPLTREMETEGIQIHYEEDLTRIPKDVQLVVFTPAVPKEHKELIYYRENNYRVVKRSEVLGWITESSFNICIAGTHGKTTISTMIAHLLKHSGYGCNAFLGGISVNYGTNFWSDPKNVCVVEADEYDRSFLKLNPDTAVISSMDADHLDIYGTAEAMEEAFIEFSDRVRKGGILLSKKGLNREKELATKMAPGNIKQLTYGLRNKDANAYANSISINEGSYQFDVVIEGRSIEAFRLNMGGMHNVENAIAAIVVASSLGIENDKIRDAVASFKGVRRRFEYIVKQERLVYIDDYAHHPEELKALISSAMELFEGRRCTVIFQPHLYSRTRDLADGFAEALDLADEIILLPLYPAREMPIEGVRSEMILDRMNKRDKRVMEKEALLEWLKENYTDRTNRNLLITAGAGDIDRLIEPIREILINVKE